MRRASLLHAAGSGADQARPSISFISI